MKLDALKHWKIQCFEKVTFTKLQCLLVQMKLETLKHCKMQCLEKVTFAKLLFLLAQMKSTSLKTLLFLVFLCFPKPKSSKKVDFPCILLDLEVWPKVSGSRFRSYRLPQTPLGASQTTVWEEDFGAYCPGVTFWTILVSNLVQIWGHVSAQETPKCYQNNGNFRKYFVT